MCRIVAGAAARSGATTRAAELAENPAEAAAVTLISGAAFTAIVAIASIAEADATPCAAAVLVTVVVCRIACTSQLGVLLPGALRLS